MVCRDKVSWTLECLTYYKSICLSKMLILILTCIFVKIQVSLILIQFTMDCVFSALNRTIFVFFLSESYQPKPVHHTAKREKSGPGKKGSHVCCVSRNGSGATTRTTTTTTAPSAPPTTPATTHTTAGTRRLTGRPIEQWRLVWANVASKDERGRG